MNRRTVVLVAAGLMAVAAVSPAMAKHKQIKKSYTATAMPPDPTPIASTVCNSTVPTARHVTKFTAPDAGSFEVKLTGFVGDWDLALYNTKGGVVAQSGELPGTDERVFAKMKKRQVLNIVACNWAGGPTATVNYTFTYAK